MISLPHITIWSLLICISLSICRLSCAWQQQPLPSSSTSSRNNKGRGTNLFSIRDGVNANANNGVIDDGRTRRSFFEDCSSKAAGALLTTSAFGTLFSPERANAAADEEELIDVYFGCGCVRCVFIILLYSITYVNFKHQFISYTFCRSNFNFYFCLRALLYSLLLLNNKRDDTTTILLAICNTIPYYCSSGTCNTSLSKQRSLF